MRGHAECSMLPAEHRGHFVWLDMGTLAVHARHMKATMCPHKCDFVVVIAFAPWHDQQAHGIMAWRHRRVTAFKVAMCDPSKVHPRVFRGNFCAAVAPTRSLRRSAEEDKRHHTWV